MTASPDPAALELRPLGPVDREAFEAELRRAHSAGELRASSDPEQTFTLQLFGVDPGWFGGAFRDGSLVGVILPELKVTIVRPEDRRRGIGRRLIELAVEIQRARGRDQLFMGTVPDDPGGVAFVEATGFAFHSTVWDLDLPPDREVPEPVWPDAVIVRSFDRDRDVSALPGVVNAAFADHPTPIVMEPAMFEAGLDDPNVLDEDAIILEERATGEIIGFCMNDIRRTDGVVTSAHGEIAVVGVRPDRQGRGLGRQLLRAGARYVRAAGTPNVGLAVNGRNESALALYESEGFVRARTRDRWVRMVPTAAP